MVVIARYYAKPACHTSISVTRLGSQSPIEQQPVITSSSFLSTMMEEPQTALTPLLGLTGFLPLNRSPIYSNIQCDVAPVDDAEYTLTLCSVSTLAVMCIHSYESNSVLYHLV